MTPVPRTLLDWAETAPRDDLRRAVAEADYRRLASAGEIGAALQAGHPGSAALREALARHEPQRGRTLSALEDRFLDLCESFGIPTPEVNARVGGFTVDALWRAERVIVELDGHAAHARPAAIEGDRRRDLALRRAGFLVLRYTWWQVAEDAAAVAEDVLAALARRLPAPDGRQLRR